MTDFRRQRLVSKLCDFFGLACDGQRHEDYLEILHSKPSEKLDLYHDGSSEVKMLLKLIERLKQSNYVFGFEKNLNIEDDNASNQEHYNTIKEKSELIQCSELTFEPFQNIKELQIGNATISLQEILITEDLLWVFLGIRGQYFFFDLDKNAVFVDNTLTGSILETIKTNRIMNVAMDHLKILFLTKNKPAKTTSSQALKNFIVDCGLRKYYQVLSNLEKNLSQGKLSIRQIIFHIEPFESLMHLFHELLEKSLQFEEEAQVLNLFLNWKNESNLSHSMVDLNLLEAAIVAPSLQLMSNTLLKGSELNPSLPLLFNDIIFPKRCFAILNDIIDAQKLLDYKDTNFSLNFSRDNISLSLKQFKDELDGKLLNLTTTELIIKILTVLKNMYFLARLDAPFNFFSTCRRDLMKRVSDINISRIQAFFEMAFENFSRKSGLKFKVTWSKSSLLDTLTKYVTTMESMDENHRLDLSGIDILQFDVEFCDAYNLYEKLMFKDELMAKYRLIFRLQFLLNDLIYVLIHENQKEKDLCRLFLRKNAYIFIRTIKEYFGFNVLEKQWNHMISVIRSATSINEIVKIHETFLDSCLRECLLSNPRLVQLLISIVKICHMISASSEEINVLSLEYSKCCKTFIEALNYHSMRDCEFYLGDLILQLNLNNFYS